MSDAKEYTINKLEELERLLSDFSCYLERAEDALNKSSETGGNHADGQWVDAIMNLRKAIESAEKETESILSKMQ